MTTPTATYRLQLRPGFGFADAAELVGYLARLGVSHVYLSPSLEAVPGSTHGYDVTDPGRLRAELGGDEGFARLREAVRRDGLGIVLDIVPNHLGLVSPHNRWWWDVLQHGPESRYARHFDIDWIDGPAGVPQVLVPHLAADLLTELTQDGGLRLARQGGATTGDESALVIRYHEHLWPLRPGSLEAAGLDGASAVDVIEEDRTRLLALLHQQHYRLADWRTANTDLNYRRFFDITTLGGVRVEDREVFDDVHHTVLELVAGGAVDGLRIDHPDGLHDPVGYLTRLRSAAGDDTWLVIEKILEPGEQRRTDWPVDGTVGYEFTNLVLGLFLDARSQPVVEELTATITGEHLTFDEQVDAGKRQVLDELFQAEFRGLLDRFAQVADESGLVRDRDELTTVLREALIELPIYRTYVRAEHGEVHPADRSFIEEMCARVRARVVGMDDLIDLLHEVLTLERVSPSTSGFVMRFQQLTGPLTAKGVEDTALYRDVRFVARNEVGGDPRRFGIGLGTWHEAAARRQVDWPTTMLTTSTHDTKRSEDVRARLAVLSEQPDRWVRAVEELRELTAPWRGPKGPSPSVELLAYQTAVGAWPIGAGRLTDYLVKAAREQKRETSWLAADEVYEEAVAAFAEALTSAPDVTTAIAGLVDEIREAGWITSLAQTLLRMTAPGVPDTYQGTELWDLSLVDPDNRRPVDHAKRDRLLAELETGIPIDGVLARMEEGLPKLHVVHRCLQIRRAHPEVFGADATYEPLYASGPRDQHVVAYLRGGRVLAVAPRLAWTLGPTFADWTWGDTELHLPEASWVDELSGEEHPGGRTPLAVLLGAFPVALLVRR